MSAEKELRGENGSFDTETSGFGGDVRERSARKRPKSGKWAENFWWFCGPQGREETKFRGVRNWGCRAPFETIYGPFER